nr:MAG TPA: hypothetical protein [Bacteriophage sp.]
MNKKLLTVLQDKCKDFGLSKTAIEDLCKTGSEGITDETSEEDIEKRADSLASYAKLMQAEVTRKAQKPNPDKPADKPGEDKNNGEDEPEWFKKYKTATDKKLADLETENATLKSEKSKAERTALINSTAKRLGIPSALMKHFSLEEDADVEKALTDFKQDLVTEKLMPADEADITSSSEQAAKDDAEAWAKTL